MRRHSLDFWTYPALGLVTVLMLTQAACKDENNGPGPQPDATVVRFAAATFDVSEIREVAVITVVRAGSTSGPVEVRYRAMDGTARMDLDYGPVSGTLSWADGEGGEKTFEIPIFADPVSSDTKTVRLLLEDPSAGVQLGDPAEALLQLTNETCVEVGEDIGQNTTFDRPCYLVTDDIAILSDATLTILPGVALFFQDATSLTVNGSGRLVARGDAERPIRMVGVSRVAGAWEGLFLRSNPTAGPNELAHVHMDHAGGDEYTPANLVVFNGARVAADDCTFRNSGGWGFSIEEDAKVESFARNRSTGNTLAPGYVYPQSAGFVSPTGSYTGNGQDTILVHNYGDHADVVTDQTWAVTDVPYTILDSFGVWAKLTLAQGVRLVFSPDTSMVVQQGGSLTAIGGSGADRIVLSCVQQSPGAWRGLRISGRGNVIDGATIEWGGGGSPAADIVVGAEAELTIRNSGVNGSAGYGIWVNAGGSLNDSNNTYSGNPSGAVYRE